MRKIARLNGYAMVYTPTYAVLNPPINGWNENSSTNRREEYEAAVKAGRFIYEDELHLVIEKKNGEGSYIVRDPAEKAALEARLAAQKITNTDGDASVSSRFSSINKF